MRTTQEIKDYLQEALERADELVNGLPDEEQQYNHSYRCGVYGAAIEQVIRLIGDEN